MGSIFGNNKLFNNQNFSNSSGFGQNDFYNDSFGVTTIYSNYYFDGYWVS